MRDSTIFYRSFYEAIKELPAENQAEVYSAIFEYSLNFVEIKLIGISKTVFTLIKPQIDANIKRYINGLEPKNKPEVSEEEAKDKQTGSKTEANENENVNKNDNIYSFDDFWKEYPNKVSKAKCLQKWAKLSKSDVVKIKATLSKFIAYKPFPAYSHPNPEAYFNKKRWEDVIGDVPENQESDDAYVKKLKEMYLVNGVYSHKGVVQADFTDFRYDLYLKQGVDLYHGAYE